jgi:hypothetical protein
MPRESIFLPLEQGFGFNGNSRGANTIYEITGEQDE